MTDLEIIGQLEEKLERLLGIELIRSASRKIDFSEWNYYTLNEEEKVISLSISGLDNILSDDDPNLEEITSYISQLRFLKSLDLSSNNLSNINFLKLLSNILYLNLAGNQIKNIDSIGALKKIKCLNLSNNKIHDVTPLINCKALSILILANNLIEKVPVEIFNFLLFSKETYDSAELELEYNFFKEMFPFHRYEPFLEEAKLINYFFLKKDNVDAFLAETFINSIAKNFLWHNPLVSPPIEIVEQGIKAIQNYFDQILKEEGKTQYLLEAKLLAIGEGGVGKTTFIRKIQNADTEMPKEKDITPGIDIVKWKFFTPLNKFPDSKVNFHVNLWDFGGQKIYRGTHQIFFYEKSFYVLIDDTREQKTDFSYWLNTVEQLGGNDSCLIIILNKKYGYEPEFDESGYRSHFGKLIREVIQLDLKNDRDKIIDLQEKVKTYLKELPGIGDELPPSWVHIREELSNEKKDFISFDRFREICSGHKIADPGMIHTLSGYFNRIGAFTHFIDDPLLQERIYLNSNWLVKVVYEVLDNELAKSKKGRLTEAEIKKIWCKNELHYEINKLTQLMHKFGLMYHIPASDQYVVPAHLPGETPYGQWLYAAYGNILRFIYEFDKYMPQGIMSRLIVALHHHIKNHDLVWHKGVNIELNGAHAEIIESYGGVNRFEIRIAGSNKIEMLATIRERFYDVLKPFNKLKYKQLVPCICNECNNSDDPAFHDYFQLLKFREKGTGSQCFNTGEMVNAGELLKITEFKPKSEALKSEINTSIKTIKIFLASSSELLEDRKELREFISVENDRLHKEEIYLEMVQWEYVIDAMSRDGLQDVYNKAVKECDIFLSLFFTKVGKYTEEEFEHAFGQFKNTGKPFIYTYFKNAPIYSNQLNEDINSKFNFEKKLEKLKNYKTTYNDINDLKFQFKRQLEYLLPQLIANNS